MNHKKVTYQGYYNKKLWSKGAPKVVRRNCEKTFRNYLKKNLKKELENFDKN